jgi:hypothetical protein
MSPNNIEFNRKYEDIVCPMCRGASKSPSVIIQEDKTKTLSYVGHLPMYAKKYVCTACGYEFDSDTVKSMPLKNSPAELISSYKAQISELETKVQYLEKLHNMIKEGATGYDLEFEREKHPNEFQRIFRGSLFMFRKIGNEKVSKLVRKEKFSFKYNPMSDLKERKKKIEEDIGYLKYKIAHLQNSE